MRANGFNLTLAMQHWYGIHDILGRSASDSALKKRTAVTFDGVAHDYASLQERVLKLRGGLAANRIAPGDRVAVLMGNSLAWIEAMFAITLAGAICVPVNVLLRGSQIDHVLRDCGAKMIVVDALAERALAELAVRPEIALVVGDVQTPADMKRLAFEDVVASGAATMPEVLPKLLDPAMIYYTSGTTGQPKGAVHTHSGILWNTFHQVAEVGLTKEDVYLLVPSLSWSAGFHDVTMALWWIGGTVAVLPSGNMTVEKIVTGVEESGATHVLMVPTLLKQLILNDDQMARLRKTKLRRICTGGEPVPQAIIDSVHGALPDCRIVQLYGFSEFPLMTTILSAEDSPTRAHNTGKASSIVTLAVRTRDGVITDRGKGEVLVRSPATMIGYHNRPETNAETFKDGWFNTGDTGRIDEDGFMTLTGRVKDMIISGGMNVYARDVEEVLYKLDGVREAAVVGIPDDKWGEAVVAIVVVNDVNPSKRMRSQRPVRTRFPRSCVRGISCSGPRCCRAPRRARS